MINKAVFHVLQPCFFSFFLFIRKRSLIFMRICFLFLKGYLITTTNIYAVLEKKLEKNSLCGMDEVHFTPRRDGKDVLRSYLHMAPEPGGMNGWQILLDTEDWTFLETDLVHLTSNGVEKEVIRKKLEGTGFWRYFADEKLVSGATATLSQHAAFAYILSGFTLVSSFLSQSAIPSTETIEIVFEGFLVAAFGCSLLSAIIASGMLGFLATFGDSPFVKMMFLKIRHTLQWPLYLTFFLEV